MACISASGEITDSARHILTALLQVTRLEQVAAQTSMPLYRIRSAVRELSGAGLVVEGEDGWITTDSGRNAIRAAMAQS